MRSLVFKGITWYDDPSPSEKDLRTIQKQFGFHDLDIDDCLSEHERPKVEDYDSYLFLVFHIPYMSKHTDRIGKEEVNIFLGPDFIVTLHEGRIALLDELWKKLEESEEVRKTYLDPGTGYFLYELMNQLFDGLFPVVDTITKEIRRIEGVLFENEEQVDLLKDIMSLKRNIITMRSILLPQRTLIATLEHKNRKFISEDLALYFDDILDAIERQWSLLDTAKEMIDALQETHEAWLQHKTNAIVRVLTIFSVTMLPLTFLASLYGMNVVLPYQEHPQVFGGVVILMISMVVLMVGYFARKGWL
jgi:magnesium transporter